MKKMEKKKELKRTAILEAAVEIFRADGYIGARMDSIAAKAGVTKQTVYRYYNAKEALYLAVLEYQEDTSHANFLSELDREDDREALLFFAKEFVRCHLSAKYLATMRLMMTEGPKAPEMARAHFALGPTDVHERLAVFFAERFNFPDIEYASKMLTSTLLSMTMGVLLGRFDSPTAEDMDEHAERTVDVFMRLMS